MSGRAKIQGVILRRIRAGLFIAGSCLGLAQRDCLPGLALSGMSDEMSSQHLVNVPLGLPEVPIPDYNPITPEKIALGKQLFFDKRLSEGGSISCASCHDPQKGFSDGVALSQGIRGLKGQRNTPTLINVAFQPYQFWDGRATSLEDQSLGPLHNPQEMGQGSELALTRLNRIPYYREQFRKVFKSSITNENIAQALASYERTLLSGNSPYDQFMAGDQGALSQQAVDGLRLFNGKAHCSLCHQGFNFSDGLFHNLGVGWNGKEFQDPGRFGVTGIFKDRGAFKTPTLRQVSDTAPYMHDGSLANLEAVVDFYVRGGNPNPHLDILIQPLQLTLEEKKELLAFLKALSAERPR
jgi:cytochrome c peroxidase